MTGVGCHRQYTLIVLPEIWGWSQGEKGGVAITTGLCNQYKWPGQLKVPFGVGDGVPHCCTGLPCRSISSFMWVFPRQVPGGAEDTGRLSGCSAGVPPIPVPHHDHLLEPGEQAGFPLTSIKVFRLPGYEVLPGGDCVP